ncbi:MAG: GNAT family N-acetyltransferase [Rhodobacteraceae bacterium]|nr:GNAT family N-acetyltransferase [Paracoccaceae bacterium]
MTPHRLGPEDPGLGAALDLVRAAFAVMDGVVDPPSSIHRLDLPGMARAAAGGEVWVLGDPPLACVTLTPGDGHLYLGKLAVAEAARGRGLARRLVDLACGRARAMGLPEVRLQTRVELTGNQAAFRAMGFMEVGRTAHPGYDRPTSITYARAV